MGKNMRDARIEEIIITLHDIAREKEDIRLRRIADELASIQKEQRDEAVRNSLSR